MKQYRTLWAIICGIVVGLLPGCAGNQQVRSGYFDDSYLLAAPMAVTENAVIAPASYSGDVIFKVNNELPTTNGPLPFVVFLGAAA